MINQGEVHITHIITFPITKNPKLKKLPSEFGKLLSIVFKSLLSLFKILPNGTRSKN